MLQCRRFLPAALGLLALLAVPVSPSRAAETASMKGLLSALVAEGGIETTRSIAFGSGPRRRLDVYRAPAGKERRPIVVFLYGGGWKGGDRATYAFVGAALAAQGLTTVIPDYRVYPEVRFPGFVDDAAAAYRWTVENLARGCGEPRPVVVAGHSAGAYIAAMIALDATSLVRSGSERLPQPAALVGLAGPYAFDPTTWPTTKEIFSPAAGRADSARPITFARPHAPPTLLLHGGSDTTVKRYNSADFAKALQGRGNVAALKEYDGIGHAGLVMAIARPLRWRAPVLADVVGFIEQHAGGSAVADACRKGFVPAP